MLSDVSDYAVDEVCNTGNNQSDVEKHVFRLLADAGDPRRNGDQDPNRVQRCAGNDVPDIFFCPVGSVLRVLSLRGCSRGLEIDSRRAKTAYCRINRDEFTALWAPKHSEFKHRSPYITGIVQIRATCLKQTLDWHLPRVLGFLSGLIPETRFVNLPAPFVHTALGPPMVQIQLKDTLC